MRASPPPVDALEFDSYPKLPVGGKGSAFPGMQSVDEVVVGGERLQATRSHSGGPFSPGQLRLLNTMGVSYPDAIEARLKARRNGSDVASELIAEGIATEREFALSIARHLNLPFEPIAETGVLMNVAGFLGQPPPRMLKVYGERLEGRIHVCPTIESLDRFARYLATRPEMHAIIRICELSDVAQAIDRQTISQRYAAACLSLSADQPRLSARQAIEPLQAAFCVVTVMVVCLLAILAPSLILTIGHGAATTFFAACLAIRVPAAFLSGLDPAPVSDLPSPGVLEIGWQGVPVYSVLVALHHEAVMVPKLVAALERLDWPKTRLDIKLICEADDGETIAAVSRAIDGLRHFSLVLVPPGEPRTKPKALNHALPLAFGEFLVLYDAEDEPDPGQLREAYLKFRTGPASLACLQAPLVVTNGEAHWLSGLFALEYAALFRRLLPWFARQGLPLSLGGTSNHFLRERLVAVGGWDSHNVTEDADLGIRLHRAGYRVQTINRPTYEHAPERWDVWHRQRTRWMKGWFVTYLLHMRQPLVLLDQLGAKTMAAFQLIFLGMLVAGFAHPLFIGLVVIQLGAAATGVVAFSDLGPLVLIDIFNVIVAYSLFMALSARGLNPAELKPLRRYYVMLPAYWALLALASLRGLGQLLIAPHKWEKTPHGLESRADPADARYRLEPFFANGP